MATVTTNDSGYFEALVRMDVDFSATMCDISLRLNTYNDRFLIHGYGTYTNGYSLSTGSVTDVGDSFIKTYTAAGDDLKFVLESVMIHQALIVGYSYYSYIDGDMDNFLYVVFTEQTTTSDSWHNGSGYYRIRLSYDKFCSWDTILHEFGHIVEFYAEIINDFDFEHHPYENLIERYGKNCGTKGSWNEGFAHYFSMQSQNYYASFFADIYDITGAADSKTSALEGFGYIHAAGTVNVFFADESERSDYMNSEKKFGEGDECAVAGTLLSLSMNEELGLSDIQIWNLIKGTQCEEYRLHHVMQNIYSNVPNSKYSLIGEILEKYNIADKPYESEYFNSVFSANSAGTFVWEAAVIKDSDEFLKNGEESHDVFDPNNSLRVIIWDRNYNFVCRSPITPSENAVSNLTYSNWTNYSGTRLTWEQVMNHIQGDYFYWSIATYQLDGPETGPYYSHFVKALISDRVTEIANRDVTYTEQLQSAQENWLIFEAMLPGNYLIYSEGNLDLKVEIYDTPFGFNSKNSVVDDDSGLDYNFAVMTNYLDHGDKVYIRVSGYNSNASGAYSIIATRVFDIALNDTINGDIYHDSPVWYRFIAPENGYYTFYSTGDLDVYGGLYECPVLDTDENTGLASDDDSGEGYNFLIKYNAYVYEGDVIYLMACGYSEEDIGTHTLAVVKTPTPLTTSGQNVNISANDYVQLAFTAPTSGYYTFYTDGTGNVSLLNAFASPVTDRNSVSGALEIYNHIISGETNLVCYVDSGQTIYLRVKFDNTGVSGNVNVYYATCPLITKDVEIDGTIPADGTQIYMFIAPEDAVYTINLYSGQESAIWVYNVHPDSYNATPIVMESASGSMGASYDVIECYAGEVLFIMIGDGSSGDNEYSLIIEDIPILEGCGEVYGMVGDWGDFWFAFLAEWDCEYYFYVDCDGVIEIYDSVYDEGGETLDGDSDSLEMTDGQIVYVRITCPEYEYMDVYVTVQIEE